MTLRVFNAPPGLDYDPVRGAHSEISFGIVRANRDRGAPTTLREVIAKRLFPWGPPAGSEIDWSMATSKPWEILLPPGAPCVLWDVSGLCHAYHAGDAGLIQDLAAVVTIRWPEVESATLCLPIHEAWECSRAFAKAITNRYSVAAVSVLHVPARAWARGAPHVHLVIPCRTIRPGTGFASFCKPLANSLEGREIIDNLWAEHIRDYGFSRSFERGG